MPPALAAFAASVIGGAVNSSSGGGSGSGGGSSGGFGQGGGGGGSSLLAGGLASALNPPPTQPGTINSPSYNYIPTGQSTVDQLLQSLISSSGGFSQGQGSAIAPSISDINDPGSVQRDASANLLNTGNQQIGAGNSLIQQVMQSIGPFLQQAFDPQSALYNQTLNQVQNQANVQNAQSGVGATPYGAGVANQAVSNFNIDWQNSQLGRMLQGITGLSSLGGTATQGGALATAGAQNQNTSGQLPFLDYDQLAAAAQGLTTPAIGAAQSYMQGGLGANTLGLAQAQLAGNQNANAAAGIQQGLNQIMPWVGQGLTGLYNSIFPSSSPTDTNPATGNSFATDAAPGPNQVEPM